MGRNVILRDTTMMGELGRLQSIDRGRTNLIHYVGQTCWKVHRKNHKNDVAFWVT